jgi:hypothetical protein
MNTSCINAVTSDSAGRAHIGYLRPDSGTAALQTQAVWNYHHMWISGGTVSDAKVTNYTTPVGHPCLDAQLSGPEVLTRGERVFGPFRPGPGSPWYVWRSDPPYSSYSFDILGTTDRGVEEPMIDHTSWDAGNGLMMMNDYLSSITSTPSPLITLSTTPASAFGP